MNRICWWLIEVASQTLQPAEREAVRGDLAESGAGGARSLRDVLGLVARRQAESWTGWRPWLTAVCLVVPLGMLLSIALTRTGDSAVYVWMYSSNLNWDLLRNSGFWYELAHVAVLVFVNYLTLLCLSWATGFVLGAFSRGIAWINGALFSLMLLLLVTLGAPGYLVFLSLHLHNQPLLAHFGPNGATIISTSTTARAFVPDPNDPLQSSTFYHVVFPLIVLFVLVIAPALWGMYKGAGAIRLQPSVRVVLWAAAITTLAVMLIQAPGVIFVLKLYNRPALWQGWEMHLVRSVVYWPLLYFVVSAIARVRLTRTAST